MNLKEEVLGNHKIMEYLADKNFLYNLFKDERIPYAIELYFLCENYTYKEIGKIIPNRFPKRKFVSNERTRQLITKGIRKIKSLL